MSGRGRENVRVAVIGAGFGGIAAAVNLQRAGLRNFEVFERSDGPGGVWWSNRYPGAEVDTPNHTYSFSFMRFDWSRSHVQRDELLRYMNQTIDAFGIRDRFRFSTTVRSIQWDEARQGYLLDVDGSPRFFHIVISAVGLLSEPRYPDWPGLDSFAGPAFHTSRWEHQHDLRGKTVAVVGTGSSAAQIVPQLAETAGKVIVFQREPGWIDAKPVEFYSPERRQALANPLRYRLERIRGFRKAAKSRDHGRIHQPGSPSNLRAIERCRQYIEEILGDRPDLQQLVTPDYPFYGKRPIHDNNFYRALTRDNVALVPHAVASVSESAVVDADGGEHDVDVLVMSTGFQPSRFLAQLGVRGRGGIDIQDQWAGEPTAFLGTTVPNFPNFFMLYGPNTNNPVVLFFLERQAEFAVRSIKRMLRRRATAVEVKQAYHDVYNRWLQKQMAGSVWETANNYYKSATGRVVTQWPVSPILYWTLTRTLVHASSRTSLGRSPRPSGDRRPASADRGSRELRRAESHRSRVHLR